MGKATRKKSDKEFKTNSVKMIIDGKRKAEEMARDLDVVPSLIHKWKREYVEGQNYFPPQGQKCSPGWIKSIPHPF